MAAGFTTAMPRRTVTAFFDHRRDADEAIDRLVAAGVSNEHIRLVEGNRPGTAPGTTEHRHSTGFWDTLADLFLPDEDRGSYAEGLSRGGYLLTVSATDGNYDRVIDILDDEGTVDLDGREQSWRSEGWDASAFRPGSTGTHGGALPVTDPTSAGYLGGSDSATSALTGLGGGSGMAGSGMAGSGMTGSGMSGGSGFADETRTGAYTSSERDGTGMLGREDSIPVVKEELRVGKRDVSHGRIRVRSYTVEEPIETSVGLRSEHVEVERRPVDRAAHGNNLFRERTIEAEELAEEAVVSKETRVTEELRLRKEVEERNQSVSDTVRHTEVEIEDERDRLRGDGTYRTRP